MTVVWSCQFCHAYSTYGLSDHVMKAKAMHLGVCSGRGKYFQPRFTGFDGIPDWDSKDEKISRLEKELANARDALGRASVAQVNAEGGLRVGLERLSRLEYAIRAAIANGEYHMSNGRAVAPMFHTTQLLRYLLTL